MIGRRISGRYKILSRLGDGGMAIVYKAKDLILDRIVAVKILRSDLAGDDEFIRRFHREAESVASLSHPNIVNIYDIGEEEDCYFIVMEYVQGTTLKTFIRDYSPIPIDEAVHIMKQILLAIAHAHERGIVHRDIKPHNILIDENENVKVTDFGIAIAVTSATITYTNSIMGSAHYLSPEQAKGGKATVKSDIYALGIVMFELLTGRLPFPGTSPVTVALKHLSEPMPFPKDFRPEVPQSLENIVIRAVAKNPDDRYENVTAFYNDLRTALDSERKDEPRLVLPNSPAAVHPSDEDEGEETLKMAPIHPGAAVGLNDEKKEKTISEQSGGKQSGKKKKKKKWMIFFIILFLLLLIGAISAFAVFPKLFYVNNVVVPDVAGKTYNQAADILQRRHLKAERRGETDEKVKKGLVIRQNPGKNTEVKEQTPVTLYVSTGPKKIKVDDYIGYDRDSLLDSIDHENFKKVVWHKETSATVPEGEVMAQKPKAGSHVVPSKTILELTYSVGVPDVYVPDIKGLAKDEAERALSSQGLTVKFSDGDYSDEIKKGKVLKQVPAAGTSLSKGSTVTAYLSKGSEKEPKEVTRSFKVTVNSSGTSQSDGNSTIEPLHVQIYYTDAKHDNAVLADEMISKTKTYQLKFLINPDKTASYKVLINGQVEKEETIDYPS